jgi:UDP-hydrolysing UDP-N-acetyl-D-glucosamine 2-epimerase
MRSVLRRIHEQPDLSLDIVVTGMHLMEEFGHTVDEIQSDGYSYHTVDVRYEGDTQAAMAIFIGRFIETLTPVVSAIKPDIILLLGDRGEMLAGAIVGTYLSIPVAHIHGGEITSTVDDAARHAITKLASIHFPATEKSKNRIINMGEEPSRVFLVGAPGLDQILEEQLLSQYELMEKYHLDFSQPIVMVIQHPVTEEVDYACTQIRETMEAIVTLDYQTILIYPNADAGGRAMISVIREYSQYPSIQTYQSIPHRDYLSLLKEVSVLVGNSSSALIEAPSFGLPAINIGTRQNGRERGTNVIDSAYTRVEIRRAIEKALTDSAFLEQVRDCLNPYGDGKSSERITYILSTIDLNNKCVQE